MAFYLGDYRSDSGRIFYRVPIGVWFVDVNQGISGVRSASSPESDLVWLPDLWFTRLKPLPPRAATCPPPDSLRFALLWTGATRYLRIEIPWLPGTDDYQSFWQALAAKNPTLTLGIQGESISQRMLKLA